MSTNRSPLAALAASALLWVAACADGGPPPRNLILFVPDGLRALQVSAETAPTMAALRDRGVNFTNPHSLFPTFTMPNAAAMGTGHQLGDTGVYGNTLYTAVPIAAANGTVTPFTEIDAVLGELNRHFDGNFISEEAILHAAYAHGFAAFRACAAANNPKVHAYSRHAGCTQRGDARLIDGTAARASSGGAVRWQAPRPASIKTVT